MKTYTELHPTGSNRFPIIISTILIALAFGAITTIATIALVKVYELEETVSQLKITVKNLQEAKEAIQSKIDLDYGDYKTDDDSLDLGDDEEDDDDYFNLNLNKNKNDDVNEFNLGEILFNSPSEFELPTRTKRDIGVSSSPSLSFIDGGGEEIIRKKRHRRDEAPIRKHYGKRNAIAAVHYNGYTPSEHPHVKQGHMRHANYTYLYWKESNWSKGHYNNYFRLNNGVLEINEPGLYFIYGQIHFLTTHDNAGYQILKNNGHLLSCMVTSLTYSHQQKPELKSNTCYTAGAEYLEAGDRISLRDINDYAYSKFENGKSFFGAIKLN